MNVALSTADLRAALKACAAAVMARPNLPALACVVISTTGEPGELMFSTTNYQTWVSYTVPHATVAEPLSMAVSHRLLSQIAASIRGKTVDLDAEGNVLRISADRSYWLAPSLPEATGLAVPDLPEITGTIDAAELSLLIGRTSSATSDDAAITPRLDVIQLITDDGTLTASATDRYKIHRAEADYRGHGDTITTYVEAESLTALVGSLSGEVSFYLAPGLVGLSDARMRVLSRTAGIDKWVTLNAESIAARHAAIKATSTVNAPELLDAIHGAELAGQDVPVWLHIGAEQFSVTAADIDSGTRAQIEVEDFTHDGPGLVVKIMPHVITPALLAAGTNKVTIGWTGPGTGALVEVPGESAVYIIMPLRDPATGWDKAAVA